MWDQVKVTLPYSVTIGQKTIPPGDYLIKQLDNPDGNSPVLLIYGSNGMRFETSAMTIHALDVKTPNKTDVTLHHIGDNYYFDKIWIAGKNYGYEIPLPSSVRERATESAAISVPSEPQSSSQTSSETTTTATNTDTTNTATSDNSSASSSTTTETAVTPPPPPETPEPAAAPQEQPAPPPPVQPPATDDNSANREQQPAPSMPATSAGWLAMLLSGGTLSGIGMSLRRRKQ